VGLQGGSVEALEELLEMTMFLLLTSVLFVVLLPALAPSKSQISLR
jgi:competence protein ComGC